MVVEVSCGKIGVGNFPTTHLNDHSIALYFSKNPLTNRKSLCYYSHKRTLTACAYIHSSFGRATRLRRVGNGFKSCCILCFGRCTCNSYAQPQENALCVPLHLSLFPTVHSAIQLFFNIDPVA